MGTSGKYWLSAMHGNHANDVFRWLPHNRSLKVDALTGRGLNSNVIRHDPAFSKAAKPQSLLISFRFHRDELDTAGRNCLGVAPITLRINRLSAVVST